jgi:hypothetical protein
LQGDRVAWPIYITIRNLPCYIYRKQKILVILFIRFLLISKNIIKLSNLKIVYMIRLELYYKAIKIILEYK